MCSVLEKWTDFYFSHLWECLVCVVVYMVYAQNGHFYLGLIFKIIAGLST